MGDMEAVNRHVERRAEEATKRAEELQRRYRELTDEPGVTDPELQHAHRAAIAARSNAAEAQQLLAEHLDRSAAIHQLAAQAHDQAAAFARGHADKVGHSHAAERHRAAARRDRTTAVQQQERASAALT